MIRVLTLLIVLLCGFPKAANAEDTMQVTNLHKTLVSQTGWLNTSRPLKAEDLQGRIILLDFWTYCCINCMHVIPDLKYLEDKFGDDLTVIGVHSAKFANERDTENIKNAILRYDIHHAVVNDFDFSIWKKFGVNAWPTFILINPDGIIEETYSGEGNREAAARDIEQLQKKYAGKINTAKLPIALEKDKTPESLLSFPGKLTQAYHGDGHDAFSTLFVSDSGHHRIAEIVMDSSRDSEPGDIITIIGSGKEGFKDGAFEDAEFRRPQGVLFDGMKWPHLLYIADTENHSLRVADLQARTVTTLAGTGKQGFERSANNAPALSTPLASPWDLAFYPDDKHIVIAMAGTHQLWSYDIDKKTVSVIAGNGRESIDDGKYPFNSLSQPSGLATRTVVESLGIDSNLYFVDSETSALRMLENGKITTLIGTGLFDFGYKEGKQGEALMQHPLGLYADYIGGIPTGEDRIYIADSYNHSIRSYDIATGVLSNFAGHGERGNQDGPAAEASFNEPNDLLKSGNKFYVVDTNNNAIRVIEGGKVSTLKISALTKKEEAKNTPQFATDLPNLEKTEPMNVAESATVSLELKEGWHINDEAPSNLTLFDVKKKAVKSFGIAEIKTRHLALSKLTPGKYYLQGTLYYCEDKAGSQCLIKSFDVELNAKAGGAKEITLKLN
jgi:thiol-disulfide isomerase/thioredoxin